MPTPTQTITGAFFDLVVEPTIKTILLDLDNTCYEYEPCHEAALAQVQTEIEQITGSLSDFVKNYALAQKKVKDRIPTHAASHSRILYFQALFELLGRTDGHLHAADLEATYWNTFIATMKLTPGLSEFLADCRGRGKTIVVVSDLTTTVQCAKLAALGIASAIDYLVTAEEAGSDKPHSAPFLVALEKAGGTPETTLVIGDSLDKDITGATALGMPSILFCHAKKNNSQTVR
jgi:HAD superfamily hydrolase (TIGR01509 family)